MSSLSVSGQQLVHRSVWAKVAMVLVLSVASPALYAQSDPDDAPVATVARTAEADLLDVQSAFITLNSGVYQLFVRVQYPLDEIMRAALSEGTSVSFVVDVEVSRARRFWLDAGILSIKLVRELSFQSVTERYVVRDPLGEGVTNSFATLEEALGSLGQIDAWPILVTSQLTEPGEYAVRVRARIERGRLTDALRTLMFWSDDFQRESEWYEWSLQR
jgi:hypothetical protein